MATRTTSADNRSLVSPTRGGFTLLEIIIALSVIAILVTASLPYLFDAYASAAGDRASDAIVTQAQEARSKALESGTPQRLALKSNGITGVDLPSGWQLEVKGFNDSKFHAPLRAQVWEFTPSGICEPLSIRLSDHQRSITLSFDALTAQQLPDHE